MEGDQAINNKAGADQGDEQNRGIAAPTITLPKGGGAISGIGEKFAANPVTGTGSLTIPIATSPGRSGFGPQLSLSYDSGAGNGSFGLGWNLSLPSITRKTDKGLPQYLDFDESDVFILSGAEDLVPVLVQSQSGEWAPEIVPPRTIDGATYDIRRYRPRIEGLFARIERWSNRSDSSDSFWRSISKDNVTTWYGKKAESRIADPADPTRIFSWLICESYDDKGNVIVYGYKAEDSAGLNLFQVNERNRTETSRAANRYLKYIRYGNHAPYFPELEAATPWPTPPGLTAPDASDHWFFEVIFDYGEHGQTTPLPQDSGAWELREDPFSTYRAGFEIRTYSLCQRILMFHHFPDEAEVGENCLVRSTDFNYHHQQSPFDPRNPVHSVIDSANQYGYQKKIDNSYSKKSLPPVEFGYSPVIWGDKIQTVASESTENLPSGVDGGNYQWLDLDGEGLSGVLTEQGGAWLYKHNESPVTRLLKEKQSSYTARLGATQVVKTMPAGGLTGASNRQFLDLAGNGQVDLVAFSPPLAGFYERTDPIGETQEQGWRRFQAFKSLPNINWNDPNLKFFDLTGDGHADLLITENEVFTWYPSLAEQGFEQSERVHIPTDEEQGPRVIFAGQEQTLFQADFSGDGLTDIVRIRNGEVCYWPNLGYGHFGAKVTMDNAPHFDNPDQFHPNRLRLTDIDGSGTVDMIYLGCNKTQFWFNRSGNGWSEPHTLEGFPSVDNIATVTAVDLLGNGTACLVWSSPLPGEAHAPMRYIELMAAGKPHLLVHTKNNLGAETHIQYAPSTYFYLQDKQAGKPWITKLPFPVHVVEKVTVTDKWNKTTFSSTYSYHHGYFDGHEREFRGFGRVEQIDAESYGEFAEGNINSPFITDDLTLYQPPVKTVTWYHTGAMIDREKILSQFKHEYFPHWLEDYDPDAPGTFEEAELPEPGIKQQNLDAEEFREALRACKGTVLRQEVYELDVDALAQGVHQPVKLFSTAYRNCNIQRIQARAMNPHAVFLVAESEAITYQYELDLQAEILTPDPRIAHTLNLNIDEYGNVLQAVAVVYPRIGEHQDDMLELQAVQQIHDVQQEIQIAYSESHFTNDINEQDNYRQRIPCEALSYELTGFSPADGYFSLEELQSFRLNQGFQTTGQVVPDIEYHVIPDRTTLQKRIVEHSKILYFDDKDRLALKFLKEPLLFGEQGNLGLPYETYTLALTKSLLGAVLSEKRRLEIGTELDDASKSGYISGAELGGIPEQYWIRSGIAGFADDAADHFFLPERYTDAFDKTTTLEYDVLDLFITSSTDPIGNTVSVEKFDFRVLAPRELKDINDNLSEVVFDILGLPTAVAVKGKGDQADNLLGFNDELLNPDRDTLINFFIEPRAAAETISDYQQRQQDKARDWLGNATARTLYYFGEVEEALPNGDTLIHWGEHPASACGIVREKHVKQLEPNEKSNLQLGFEYSDGGGNVLVTKVQAEPENLNGPLRWIANGKTILNNKGNPVKQYEPYFSENPIGEPSHHFEEPVEVGVTAIIYYDTADRVVRTELPDGSVSRVEFSPWHVSSYDQNDTVLEAGNEWFAKHTVQDASAEFKRAALLTEEHADTPTQVFLDSLARDVISIEHNKYKDESGNPHDEKYLTFTKLDAEGKPLWIRDARGNLVMQYIFPPKANNASDNTIPANSVPCYDIAGNLLFQHSMDGGDRWMVNDATGQPFYAWDKNENEEGVLENRLYHTTYDNLRRPLEQRLQINNGTAQVIEKFVYGDSETAPADAVERNLRGQLYQHYDSSGLVTNEDFDFKGNLLNVKRQLIAFSEDSITDWTDINAVALDETYTQNAEYDALNRMTRHYNWHHTPLKVAVYEPSYNKRGVLKSEDIIINAEKQITADGFKPNGGSRTTPIKAIRYDAKGQRQKIVYGNKTATSYVYDPKTFRLINLTSTNTQNNKVLQNLNYTYDPIGNITEIIDKAQQDVFFNNQQVTPDSKYEYDALYRLIKAEGREHAVQNNVQRDNTPFKSEPNITFPNSPDALQRYAETYQYDSVGNILNMTHGGGQGTQWEFRWKRCYQYALDSNRLLSTGKPVDLLQPSKDCPSHYDGEPTLLQPYQYDTHGSMLNLNRASEEFNLHWDSNDMIHHINLGGGGDAYYDYGSDKERSRKRIIKNNGNIIEERLYLGGMERYRRWENTILVEEIETYHLFDGEQRVLMVENVLLPDNPNPDEKVLYRYQYSNHLDSVGLEVDEAGSIISYEEYHPFGTTAYSAKNKDIKAAKKRYRYTGMERDEESGLSYHSARYYLPWLGRWGSVDPEGLVDGGNLYGYAGNNPISFTDVSGTERRKVTITDSELYVAEGDSKVDDSATTVIKEGGRIYNGETYINIQGNFLPASKVRVLGDQLAGARTIVEKKWLGSRHEGRSVFNIKLVNGDSELNIIYERHAVAWHPYEVRNNEYSIETFGDADQYILLPSTISARSAPKLLSQVLRLEDAYDKQYAEALALLSAFTAPLSFYGMRGATSRVAALGGNGSNPLLVRSSSIGGAAKQSANASGWAKVSRLMSPSEAKLWRGRSSMIQPTRGGPPVRTSVSAFDAPTAGVGKASTVRVDFSVPTGALRGGGKEGEWMLIFGEGRSIPIRDLKITNLK